MDQLDELERQQQRDDSLWSRELAWAHKHGITQMKCPCNSCARRGKPFTLKKVQAHLIHHKRHPLFRVWKGPGPISKSDEEWAEVSRGPVRKLTRQEVDQGVEVEQLLDDLFISADDLGLDAVKGPTNQMEKGMLGMSMVQEVCDIMDDLAAMPNYIEGHQELNEPEPHQRMENLAAETFEEFVAGWS
jgi:hypothetical protein